MPEEITVEVGDTDVIVRETDEGFEVEETDDEASDGPFLRMESSDGYGFAIPVEKVGDGVLEVGVHTCSFPLYAVWDTSVDYADDLKTKGRVAHRATPKLDGHAILQAAKVVDDPTDSVL